jgi:hypothetical protein
LYLLTGTLGAFACYEGVRSALAFRSARSARDVDQANLRALAAVAFASLGSGEALRYVGIVLFAVLAFAYARFILSREHPPGDSPPPPSSFESQPTVNQG